MTNLPTDEILIFWAKNGRAAGFEGLVKRYEKYAFTLALRIAGSREEAEEVAQDAFLKAFRGLAEWRGEGRFGTWLYRIVHNTGLNSLRKNRAAHVQLDGFDRPPDLPDGHISALEKLEAAGQNQQIGAVLARLSPEDSTILTLFYLNEQTLDEIGKILQIEPNAAKTRLCRARARMRHLTETQFSTIFAP